MKNFKWLLLLAVFATPLFFASCNDDDDSPTYKIRAKPNNPDYGTVTGDGVFAKGKTVELIATPMPDYIFKHWTEGGQTVFMYPNYSFEAVEDRNLVAVFGDDEDDDNGTSDSYFTYDGNTYSLANGFMISWGQDHGVGYEFEIMLFSEGVDFSDFSGTGNAVFFDLSSSDQNGPAAGTYTYEYDNISGDPFTFFWADILMNFDFDDFSGTALEIIDGTIKVAVNGSNFTFTFDMVAEDNKPVKGKFSGPLTSLDKKEITRKKRTF